MNVKDVIEEYYTSTAFRDLSTDSKRQYVASLKRVEERLGDRDINSIRRSDVMREMNMLSNTPAMAGRLVRVMSVLFTFAVNMDYMDSNPAYRMKKPKIGAFARWEVDEIRTAIQKTQNPVVKTAIMLAFFTGQRESDILRMQWSDIKGGVLRVQQQKTGTFLEIKIHKALSDYLAKLPKDKPEIVGKHILPSNFRTLFRKEMDAIGIRKTFHGLRKTVASFLAEAGASTKNVGDLLGHKTLSMVTKYMDPAMKRKSIENAVNQLPTLEE